MTGIATAFAEGDPYLLSCIFCIAFIVYHGHRKLTVVGRSSRTVPGTAIALSNFCRPCLKRGRPWRLTLFGIYFALELALSGRDWSLLSVVLRTSLPEPVDGRSARGYGIRLGALEGAPCILLEGALSNRSWPDREEGSGCVAFCILFGAELTCSEHGDA